MTANQGILRMEMPVGVPGIEWVIWWGWGELTTLELSFAGRTLERKSTDEYSIWSLRSKNRS